MQAILLAGGKGVRLQPLTHIIPKPLSILGDTSIIEIILSQLKRWGFDEVIMILGYKPELIQAVTGKGSKWQLKIDYIIEEEPLGTVGGLKLISEERLDDNFLLMNSDILTTLNYGRLVKYHIGQNALATLGAIQRLEQIELGVLEVNEQEELVDFREKPIYHFLAMMGVAAFSKRILEYIPVGKHFGIDDLVFTLLKRGECPKIFRFSGPWYDIGRPDDYVRACMAFEKKPSLFLA
jgi:NDP-sugar pyrophosphorylase family protein